MKPIRITQKDLDRSIPLTNADSENSLLRVGIDRYVVIDSETHHPIAAFESEEFSKINDTISRDGIIGISISGSLLEREEGEEAFGIRILTRENNHLTTYGLTEMGNAFAITELRLTPRSDEVKKSKDFFKLGGSAIGEETLLTKKLKGALEPIIEKYGAKKVLKRMLKEAFQDGDRIRNDHAAEVNGKFCDFAATELRCGRVVFMTLSEISSMGVPLNDRARELEDYLI